MNAKTTVQRAAAISLPALLFACGGDSGGDTPIAPITPPAALSIAGTAATGAAIAAGTVTAKCAAGAATTATTAADGSYTVGVTSGVLPCVLQVTSADGATSLYSVATGSGASATANITPLTQLVVASLGGADPAALFASFGSGDAASITSTTVASAQAAVVKTLATAGIDVSTLGDLVTGPLTAATATASGNAYDTALDALQAKLAATLDSDGQPMTLATLTDAVATTSPVAPPAAPSGKISLPPEMLLMPSASTCAALRSGVYRVVEPTPGASLAEETGKITLDAVTLGIVYADGSSGTLAPHATEACRFTNDGGKSDLVVSQAGVVAIRSFDSVTGKYSAAIAFPEQAHTLAELAGTWNTLGMQYDSAQAAYVGTTVKATLSATGVVSDVSSCGDAGDWNVSACEPVTSGLPSFQVDADGGFDGIAAGATVASSRTFAYRSGSGDLMMVNVDDDGSFEVRTLAKANAAPATGRVYTGWDLRYTNQWLGTPAVSESTNTVQSVDATGSSYVRLAKTVGGTDEHLETVLLNSPRDGYNFRAAATVLGTDGTTSVAVTEWTNLGLHGMGLNALLRPAQKQFMFSVQQH
jgi:hypothetical protein